MPCRQQVKDLSTDKQQQQLSITHLHLHDIDVVEQWEYLKPQTENHGLVRSEPDGCRAVSS